MVRQATENVMQAVQVPREQRFRFSCVHWMAYLTYSDSLCDQPVRVTYSHGAMEILSPSLRHENRKKLLAQLVEVLLNELGIDRSSAGSATFRREDLERAFEPDEA